MLTGPGKPGQPGASCQMSPDGCKRPLAGAHLAPGRPKAHVPGMLEALQSPIHVASVTLIVRDLARVATFHRDVLGLIETPTPDGISLGPEGGPTLLRLAEPPDATAEPPNAPGLFHTAFLLPERRDLARWVAHAQSLGVRIEGASDHRVSEAVYLSDPEGNGIEVYVDRPRSSWPRHETGIAMGTDPLDGRSLMAELDGHDAKPWRFPAEGRIGHVHLKVGDLAAAEAFYRERLGMDVMARYPGAVFMSWGGYHHHIAVNIWRSRGAAARQDGMVGLAGVALAGDGPAAVTDPAGNRIAFQAMASIS
jgi:catechol 2,3-dioxygenase